MGGQKMPDIVNINRVQKLKWVILYLKGHTAFWTKTMEALINFRKLDMLLLANFDFKDFYNTGNFYFEVLKSLYYIRYPYFKKTNLGIKINSITVSASAIETLTHMRLFYLKFRPKPQIRIKLRRIISVINILKVYCFVDKIELFKQNILYTLNINLARLAQSVKQSILYSTKQISSSTLRVASLSPALGITIFIE